MDEYRHIGPQAQTEPLQLYFIQPTSPQPVQGNERGRRIGTATAKPPAQGNMLLNPDIDPCLLYTSDAADDFAVV